MALGLGVRLAPRMRWQESHKLMDIDGVVHMGLITEDIDIRNDRSFVLCLSQWVDVGRFHRRETHVTCLVCVLFRIEDGDIKMWPYR